MAVKRKLEQRKLVQDAPDTFAEFREIELLELEHHFRYRHSLGKLSKFFLALEEGKLLATRCPVCSKVWLPPRALCPDDLSVTSWLELPGTGKLKSWTCCPKAPTYAETEGEYLLAYVNFDGASTLFLHQLRNVDKAQLTYNLPLKAVFAQTPVQHPLNLFWLEPA